MEFIKFTNVEKVYKTGIWCMYYYHIAINPTFKTA